MRCLLLTLAVALLVGAAPARALDRELLESLRSGGYMLYFRHAATDWSQTDRNHASDWDSCDPQQMRQLSAEGRATARRVGAALRQLRIPIGAVAASEFCRAAETARLLDIGPIELRRRAGERLATVPAAGTNTALIAHGNVFVLLADPRPVEGGTAILRPDGAGGFSVVAQVAPEEWEELARRD